MKVAALIACVLLTMSGLRAAVLEAPTFNRAGGMVPTGFAFRLTNSNPSGAVMFTVDLADPRNTDGTVYTNARAAWGPVTVNRTRR